MKKLLLLLPLFCCQILGAQNSTDIVRLTEQAIRAGYFKAGGGEHRLHLGVGYPNRIAAGLKSIDLLGNIAGIDLLGGLGSLIGLDGINPVISGDGKATPQFNISFDAAINENFSIGPYFGYASASTPDIRFNFNGIEGTDPIDLGGIITIPGIPGVDPIRGTYRYDVRMYSFGVRAVVNQWAQNKKLQLYLVGYAGVTRYDVQEKQLSGEARGLDSAGVLGQLFDDDGLTGSTPNISLSGQLGGRYNFSQNVGLYLEAGYGLNLFNAGLIVRLHKKKQKALDAIDGINSGDLKTTPGQ